MEEALTCTSRRDDDSGSISPTHIENADDDEEHCVTCGLTDDDKNEEVWIKCTYCFQWVYEHCLPNDYLYSAEDIEFLCPCCAI